jgi:hypothetical protein
MLISCHQFAGHNQDIKISKRALENVERFKYLGTM